MRFKLLHAPYLGTSAPRTKYGALTRVDRRTLPASSPPTHSRSQSPVPLAVPSNETLITGRRPVEQRGNASGAVARQAIMGSG
jgi:hypothetical protein